MKELNNITTESNDILSEGVGLKHVSVGGIKLSDMEYYKNLSLKDIIYEYNGETLVEQWKDIPDWGFRYLVSNLGRVKTLDYKKSKKERIMKQNINSAGYLSLTLCKDGKQTNFFVHQLVAISFIGMYRNNLQVNHKDGIKLNNFTENLEIITRSENAIHSYDIGLNKNIGSHHHYSVLTYKNVMDIFNTHKDKTDFELSMFYGVSVRNIALIRQGKRWRCVTKDKNINFRKIRKGLTEKKLASIIKDYKEIGFTKTYKKHNIHKNKLCRILKKIKNKK